MPYAHLEKYHIGDVLQAFGRNWDKAKIGDMDPAKAMNQAYIEIKEKINEFRQKVGDPPIN